MNTKTKESDKINSNSYSDSNSNSDSKTHTYSGSSSGSKAMNSPDYGKSNSDSSMSETEEKNQYELEIYEQRNTINRLQKEKLETNNSHRQQLLQIETTVLLRDTELARETSENSCLKEVNKTISSELNSIKKTMAELENTLLLLRKENEILLANSYSSNVSNSNSKSDRTVGNSSSNSYYTLNSNNSTEDNNDVDYETLLQIIKHETEAKELEFWKIISSFVSCYNNHKNFVLELRSIADSYEVTPQPIDNINNDINDDNHGSSGIDADKLWNEVKVVAQELHQTSNVLESILYEIKRNCYSSLSNDRNTRTISVEKSHSNNKKIDADIDIDSHNSTINTTIGNTDSLTLVTQIYQLNEKLKAIKRKNSAQVKKLNAANSSYQSVLDQKSSEILRLKDQLAELHQSGNTVSSHKGISGLNSTDGNSASTVNNINRASTFQSDGSLIQKISVLSSKLINQETQIDELQLKIVDLEVNNKAKDYQITSLQLQISQQQEINKKLQAKLPPQLVAQDLGQPKSIVVQSMVSTQNNEQDSKDNVPQWKMTEDEIERKILSLLNKIQQLSTDISNKDHQLETLNEKNLQLQLSYESYLQENRLLTKKNNDLELQINEAVATIATTHETNNSKITNLTKTIDELDSTIKKNQLEYHLKVKELHDIITENSNKLQDFHENNHKNIKNLEIMTNKCKNLEFLVFTKEKEINLMNSSIESNEKVIKILEEKSKKLLSENQSLTNELNDFKIEKIKLNEQLEVVIHESNEQKNELATIISSLQKEFVFLQNQITEISDISNSNSVINPHSNRVVNPNISSSHTGSALVLSYSNNMNEVNNIGYDQEDDMNYGKSSELRSSKTTFECFKR